MLSNGFGGNLRVACGPLVGMLFNNPD